MGFGASFWWPDALPGVNKLQILVETLEFENLFSGSWISYCKKDTIYTVINFQIVARNDPFAIGFVTELKSPVNVSSSFIDS